MKLGMSKFGGGEKKMSNVLSELYMRGEVDIHGKLTRPKRKAKKAGMILLTSVILILCLVVTLYASTLYTFLETKPDWGRNGIVMIKIGGFTSPGDMGIRIDGSMLMLL